MTFYKGRFLASPIKLDTKSSIVREWYTYKNVQSLHEGQRSLACSCNTKTIYKQRVCMYVFGFQDTLDDQRYCLNAISYVIIKLITPHYYSHSSVYSSLA